MAQEDRSVRGLVQDIDKRTKDLEPVLEKLSKSLEKIADSFGGEKAAEKFKAESRESLLSKFQTPVLGGGKPGTDVGTSIKDLGELLTRNHRESFEIFKSIESTLKKIEEKGGTVGGGLNVDVDLPGKRGKGKAAAKGAQAAAGAGRFLSRAVPIAAAGMAAFDAYSGYNEAAENLEIEGREATMGEKLSSAAGSAVSGLTFGLLDKKAASKGIAGFFGAGPGDKKAPPAVSTAEVEGMVAPSPEFSIESPEPVSVKAPTPEVKVEKPAPITMAAVSAPAAAPTETKAAVKPAAAPKETKAKATAASKGHSIKEQMEGDDNLEKLEMAKGELQGLQEDRRDEKRKVVQDLLKSKKYPEGFSDIKGAPNYPDELKEIDKKYDPLIEAQKKEIEKLSKAPGVKEAKSRSDSFDKELEEGSADLESKSKTEKKPSVTSKEKFIETKSETVSESGGGSTTTKRVRSADAEAAQKQMTDLEGKQEEERNTVVAKLKAEGKIGKFATLDDYENIPELKELTAKQEKERSDIQARIDKGTSTQTTQVSPLPSTTTTSSTVGNISQENMDMMQRDIESGKPIVINNTNSMSTNTSSIAPIRTLPRPSNNSFERKQNTVSSF